MSHDTPQKLLETGMEMLLRQGYNDLGIAALLEKTRIPKGSFYHHFASKEDFALQVIDLYLKEVHRGLDQCLGDRSVPPLKRVRGFFEGTVEKYRGEGYLGCLLGGLGQELSGVSETFRRKVEQCFNEIAGRIAKLGWHVVIYFEAVDLPELWDFFTSLPTTVVVDHMGRPDVSKPVDGPEFELFVKFMRDYPNVWSKVSCPERLSVSGPPALNGERQAYRDVIPFARRIVETFPDRVLWGTDWPHPNLKNHMPDDGLLVDFIPHIATTPELQRKLLVDNPMRLYWPEET